MSAHNASSVPKNQQWRNELIMKNPDLIISEPIRPTPVRPDHQILHQEIPKDHHHMKFHQIPNQEIPIKDSHHMKFHQLPHQEIPKDHHQTKFHQIPNQEIPKDQHHMKFQPTQMLHKTTICCEDANCDKAKLESMPEQFFNDPAQPYGGPAPEGTPPGKKEGSGAPESYMPAYCPCVVNRGHLVTICCVRRDCDEATKIGEPIREPTRERPRPHSHFKY